MGSASPDMPLPNTDTTCPLHKSMKSQLRYSGGSFLLATVVSSACAVPVDILYVPNLSPTYGWRGFRIWNCPPSVVYDPLSISIPSAGSKLFKPGFVFHAQQVRVEQLEEAEGD